MSLLPKTPTPKDGAEIAVDAIENLSARTLSHLDQKIQEGFRVFWFNADATPQEICDLKGKDAWRIFYGHGAMVQARKALGQIAGESTPYVELVPPFGFTINNDGPNGTPGTVTILNTPFVPSET